MRHFFGYGSLVNTATHDFADPRPARVRGWRRRWCHSAWRDVAFLSVERAEGVEIDGLVAEVPGSDWAALDAREHAYDRLPLGAAEITHPVPVQIYRAKAAHVAPPSVAHPILLSYLDVVVQGYLRAFGPDGVQGFFDSTAGWDGPVLDDRSDPVYPRHQTLSQSETDLVDKNLSALGVRVLAARV